MGTGRRADARIHESGNLSGAVRRTPSWKEEAAVKRSLVTLMMAVLVPSTTLAQIVPTQDSAQPGATTPAPDVKQTDPVVITATKVETPQSRLGAAVSIVTDDDVRTYHYSGVEEALRQVPGVEIQRSGSRGKTSAALEVIRTPELLARERGWTVAHDDPYRGGFSTQHYGRPSDGIHAVQVELARRLYMDEQSLAKKYNDFDNVKGFCEALVARLGTLALG